MPRKPDPENLFSFIRTTAATVTLGPEQRERVVWDRDTPGFGLRLRTGGAKVWVIRPAPSSGKYGLITIGPTTQLSLNQARDAARDSLAKARLGEGPREARRQQKQAEAAICRVTFTSYLERMKPRLKLANYKDLTRYLDRDFADLHQLPVSKVTRADVSACIAALAKSAPAAANRARSQLSTFFVWAIGEGLLDVNPVIGTNKPARDVTRSRVLDDAELLKVWRACGDDDFGRILKLLILTGQRRDEVAAMAWDELDLDAAMWTIPEGRTKNGRWHEVPLSRASIEIIMSQPERDGLPLVFGRGVGPYQGFSNAKERLDLGVPLKTPWRIHDLRRSCSTGMNNIGVQPHIVEAVLNHVSGHKAGVAGTYNWAAYRREKREALALWGEHVLALGKPSLQVSAAHTKAALAEA